jgi:hypothetical protein
MSEEQGAENKEQAEALEASGSESNATLKMSADDITKRRSRWASSLASLRYIDSVSRDNEVTVRDTDRATGIWLLIICLITLLSLVVPQLASHRIPFVFACDSLVGVSLLLYVANRFGIVTTLTPRQALLTWQLMLGSSLLGIFLAINLGLLIAVLVANNHIALTGQ